MSVLTDARPLTEAVRDAIEAEFAGWQVYDYGQVPGADNNPGTLPQIYALLAVERIPGARPRMAGQHTVSGWRFTVRVAGRTVKEAQWALARVAAAVDGAVLTVSGRTTTPIQHERDQAPEPDEGRATGLSSWTTTH